MQLDFEQIKSITSGAVRIIQAEDGIRFYRFTQEQHELYAQKIEGLFQKSQATAGIKFCFRTNSKALFLKGFFENAFCRTYFSVDVFADDKLVGCLDNFSDQNLPRDYSAINFPVGVFSKSFDLGEGIKTVTVHLPWNKKVSLREFSIDDGAWIEAARPEKKLLAFGDSITQGFDSLRPSRRYIARLAQALGAEEFNKAVGAEHYYPALAETKENFDPDYIVVAYGTNDWSSSTPEIFDTNCKAFFAALHKNYPQVKTFVISPIWRVNADAKTAFASFSDIEKGIRAAIVGMDNVTVISGIDFLPHDIECFGDAGLHPNITGFDHYFNNLWQHVKEYI